ncbi:lytic transglycosylase domain-containing protein [Nocardiopsis composta]|uniref:lytic transglycosylase domain-containing protein n=1 Tax=Nocardiopsis composta TaxID=157465 RepID=UPI001610DEC5|nr:lytic murein transglycosylase [Nocardiopsis composta]
MKPVVAAGVALVSVVGAAAGLGAAAVLLAGQGAGGAGGEPAVIPPGAADIPIDTAPRKAAPRASTGPEEAADDRPGPTAEEPSGDWLAQTAEAAGLPERALLSYAAAQLALTEELPECNISWPTLAGIGAVESRHGTLDGGEVGPDGRTTGDIIGIPLDGTDDTAAIADTDGGEYDGDTRWDRAVGPMQFIPSTWEQWGADGNGDGVADPHSLDDAALAAARYLCADGRDLTDPADWRDAVLSYNRSDAYVADVMENAHTYATSTRTTVTP